LGIYLLILFIIFYIFIAPLLIFNIINSDKFTLLLNNIINKDLILYNNMFPNRNLIGSSSNNDDDLFTKNNNSNKKIDNIQVVQQSNTNTQSSDDKISNTQKVVQSNINKNNNPSPKLFDPSEIYYNDLDSELEDDNLFEFDNLNNILDEFESDIINNNYLLNDKIKSKDLLFNMYYDFKGEQIISRESIETIRNLPTNINYILTDLSLSKHYGDLYKDYLSNKNNLSFWDNIHYINNLCEKNSITHEHYLYLLSDIIKEAANQDLANHNILNKIDNLYSINPTLENKFIYLNNYYSVIVPFRNKFYTYNYNYNSIYWDDLIIRLINVLENTDKNSIDFRLQWNLYNDLNDNIENTYLGILKLDIKTCRQVPFIDRELYLQTLIKNGFKVDLTKNNSFYYWDDLECFTFKFRNQSYFIGSNNKIKLLNYIENEKTNLANKLNDFLNEQKLDFLFTDINKYNLNEKFNEFFYRRNILYFDDDLKDGNNFNYLNIYNTRIRLMEKALKSNISNLDNNLNQNKNLYK
jgi:hypothetical protein